MGNRWSLKNIVMASLAAVVIGLAGLAVLYKQGAFTEETVPIEIEKSIDGSSVQTFSIQADIPDISFSESSNGEIRVRLSGEMHESYSKYADIEWKTEDNGASVEAVVKTSKSYTIGIDVRQLLSLFQDDLKVTVELPEKAYRSLKARTDTGDITLSGIRAEELELSSDTGDITLEDYTGKQLEGHSDTGTLRLRKIAAALNLRTDTGDIYADLTALAGGMSIRSDTGDIELTLTQAFPLTADFSSDTGRVSLNAPAGSVDYETKEKRRLKGKLSGGGPMVTASTDTGSIELTVK